MRKKYTLPAFILYFLVISMNSFGQTCQGPTALLTGFNDEAIPAGWTVLNLDGNTLYWNMPPKGYTGAWQPYNHYGRQCISSASRYSNSGASDDYIITPAITLGAGPICLSWKSARTYNTPSYSNEMYDVLVSTTTADVAGLHANPPLISVNEEEEAWVDYSVDLSAYAGQTIYIGFWQYTSNGYALCIDDIKVASPVDMDAAVTLLNLPDVHLPNAPIEINGQVMNGGLSIISNFSINWAVDGGVVNTDNLTGPSLSPSEFYSFHHTIDWIPTANGTYLLKVWASDLGGGGDLFSGNDTITQVMYINDFPRTVLMEEFTNASCPPCADQNPAYDALIQDNMADEKVCALKYHVAWPGYDPMNEENTIDPEERVAYYGVYGVPFAVTDGQIRTAILTCYTGAPACIDQAYVDSLQSVPAIFDIAIGSSFSASNYDVNVKITALTDIPENSFTVQVVVLEDLVAFGSPPGTNGEEDFYQVVRKMLPSSDGAPLGTLNTGQSLSLTYSTPIESYYVPEALRVLAFVQNQNGKKIYQSKVSASAVSTGTIAGTASALQVSVTPNPAFDQAVVSIPGNFGKSELTLLNQVGQPLMKKEVDGLTEYAMDLHALTQGVYFVEVISNEQRALIKVVKH